MNKILATLTAAIALSLFAQSGHAAFTLYDLARDSMYIARGEFTSLERTSQGDRLTLRCDTWIKNWSGETLENRAEVVLEPFEHHPADAALGRDVIVGFNLINGKYYFNMAPYAWRSFYFENADHAENGLDRNEQALRNFVAINAPHQANIEEELRQRLVRQSLEYEGNWTEDKFPGLWTSWKEELLNQMAWRGTIAARDAAKAFVSHPVFKFKLTAQEKERVGALLKSSQPGSVERSYMLELVRADKHAHPDLETMLGMLREETADYCVGKLAVLFHMHDDREAVVSAIGEMAVDRSQQRPRVNALQTLAAMKDASALPFVHGVLTNEQARGAEREKFDKDAVRGALNALKAIRNTESAEVLESYIASEQCTASWELTQRAWIAYSVIDSDRTNKAIQEEFVRVRQAKPVNSARLRLMARLLNTSPEQKIKRELIQVFNED